jgi:hypothetical protein
MRLPFKITLLTLEIKYLQYLQMIFTHISKLFHYPYVGSSHLRNIIADAWVEINFQEKEARPILKSSRKMVDGKNIRSSWNYFM